MAVFHSSLPEKSLFDLVCLWQPEETRRPMPEPFEWFAGDGVTLEAKSDERALTSARAFIERSREEQTPEGPVDVASGVSVSEARVWAQLFGRTAALLDTDRLRAGQEELVDRGVASLVTGGDRVATTGAAVPLLDLFAPPFLDRELRHTEVRAWEVTFAGGTAKEAIQTEAVRGLKEQAIGMHFRKDSEYGESGERYLAALLSELPLPRTRIEPVRTWLEAARPRGGTWMLPQLRLAWKQDGRRCGFAASEADLWVIDFAGLVLLCPVRDLKRLGSQVLRDHRDEPLREDPRTRVLRLPFQEFLPSADFGKRSEVRGLLYMSGSRLPTNLPEVPVASGRFLPPAVPA